MKLQYLSGTRVRHRRRLTQKLGRLLQIDVASCGELVHSLELPRQRVRDTTPHALSGCTLFIGMARSPNLMYLPLYSALRYMLVAKGVPA